jgi:hypothetical protein
MKLAPIVTLLVTVTSCAEPEVLVTPSPEHEYVRVADVPPDMTEQLDVLFVVDNTHDMQAKQRELTYAFERLLSHLDFAAGGMPDVHVGVVSTDLGVMPHARAPEQQLPQRKQYRAIENCALEGGDGGVLQNSQRISGCTPPVDRYISDYGVGQDLREVNYTGDILDTFECISQLGTSGCVVEQPLEAMRRALDGNHELNDGFHRPDAVLAVVILTNEDDCSVFNEAFYDPMLEGTGQFSKFRCFKYGVTCDGDDVFQPGLQSGCDAYDSSEHLYPVSEYSDFLIGLKGDPDKVIATSISGDTSLVEVAQDIDGEPLLTPSCVGDSDLPEAYPAIRLDGFIDSLPNGTETSSWCAEDQTLGAISATARQIRKSLGTACLEGFLADMRPDQAGLQFDCKVSMVPPDPTLTEAIPACDDPYNHLASGPTPCYSIKSGGFEGCGDFETQLRVFVNWGTEDNATPTGTRTHVDCLVDPTRGLRLSLPAADGPSSPVAMPSHATSAAR